MHVFQMHMVNDDLKVLELLSKCYIQTESVFS